MRFSFISAAVLALPTLVSSTPLASDTAPGYYYPSSTHTINEISPSSKSSKFAADSAISKHEQVQVAHSYASSSVSGSFKTTDSYVDSFGHLHWYAKPVVDGLTVVNAGVNVNVDPSGQVNSMGHSWINPTHLERRSIPAANDNLPPITALVNFALAKSLSLDATKLVATTKNKPATAAGAGGSQTTTITTIEGCSFCSGPVLATKKYYQTPSGLEQVIDLNIPMVGHHYNAFVSISSGKVLGVSDWTSSSIFDSSHMQQHHLHKRQQQPAAAAKNASNLTFKDILLALGLASSDNRSSSTTTTTTTTSAAAVSSTTSTVTSSASATVPASIATTTTDTAATVPASISTTTTTTDTAATVPASISTTTTTTNTSATSATSSATTSPIPKKGADGGGQGRGIGGVDFKYNVVPFPKIDFSDGRQLITNPQDLSVSPKGWHNLGQGNQPTLTGNNVDARPNSADPNDQSAPISQNFKFDFPVDDANQTPPQYTEASATNMFFITNTVHDIYYKYGFTEAAGNFQQDNFGKGGQGGDAVIALSHDLSGTNNANFESPPDGQNGVMRMFIFTSVPQQRDGALDNDVVIHETMHGVSNRLTGGPGSANCLQTLISGGMGEGWSDFMAVALTDVASNTRDTDRPLGIYVTNQAEGVRRFPYSTNLQTNPLKFSDLANPQNQEVHNIGEIWEAMLNEVYRNLIDKHGFEKDASKANSGKGNTLMIQLVMGGLQRQPCNPDFIQARDAILETDKALFNGANQCEISSGFAKRGLGAGASMQAIADDQTVLPGCTLQTN